MRHLSRMTPWIVPMAVLIGLCVLFSFRHGPVDRGDPLCLRSAQTGQCYAYP